MIKSQLIFQINFQLKVRNILKKWMIYQKEKFQNTLLLIKILIFSIQMKMLKKMNKQINI